MEAKSFSYSGCGYIFSIRFVLTVFLRKAENSWQYTQIYRIFLFSPAWKGENYNFLMLFVKARNVFVEKHSEEAPPA